MLERLLAFAKFIDRKFLQLIVFIVGEPEK